MSRRSLGGYDLATDCHCVLLARAAGGRQPLDGAVAKTDELEPVRAIHRLSKRIEHGVHTRMMPLVDVNTQVLIA